MTEKIVYIAFDASRDFASEIGNSIADVVTLMESTYDSEFNDLVIYEARELNVSREIEYKVK